MSRRRAFADPDGGWTVIPRQTTGPAANHDRRARIEAGLRVLLEQERICFGVVQQYELPQRSHTSVRALRASIATPFAAVEQRLPGPRQSLRPPA